LAVNAVKKLAYVELQQVAVWRAAAQCRLRVVGGGVGAFAVATGVRLVDELGVKDGVGQPVNGVLHHQVAKRGGVDGALFGLVYLELQVRLRAVSAAVQLLMQRIQVARQVAGKLKAGALAHLAVAGIKPCLVKRLWRKRLLKQIANAFHRKAPRRSSTTRCLLEKGRPADFAKAFAECRKAPPLAPPSACAVRGDAESERNPLLSFELARELLKLDNQTPAFDELFQLPPQFGHMSRRLPWSSRRRDTFFFGPLSGQPTADHAAHFINHAADG